MKAATAPIHAPPVFYSPVRAYLVLRYPTMKHIAPVLLFLILAASCDAPRDSARPLVVTSIAPLGDWIAILGGADIDVQVLVSPASNPHTFELSPGQLRDASQASLVVLNGAGLEFWAERLLDNLRDPRTPVLTLSEGIEVLQDGHAHNHDHAHAHGGTAMGNPHFWLDPVLALESVHRIAAALITLLPARRDSIEKRLARLDGALRRLDAEIGTAAAGWASRRFVSDHAAWVYFARRYGLEEAGVIEELPGREISARAMAGLIRTMKEKDIQVVFADVRKSSRAADLLGEEAGARVARLDLLCSDGRGYLAMMRDNLVKMSAVMR